MLLLLEGDYQQTLNVYLHISRCIVNVTYGNYKMNPKMILRDCKTIHIQELQFRGIASYEKWQTTAQQQWRQYCSDCSIYDRSVYRTKGLQQRIQQRKNMMVRLHYYRESGQMHRTSQNGLFEALMQAYLRHGEIYLKPDYIWLVILNFVSEYISHRSRKARQKIVGFSGKRRLQVLTQSQTDFQQFVNGMREAIRQSTQPGLVKRLQCSFSTTGPFQQLMSSALIMDSCKHYFQYEMYGICGIAKIHMAGTEADWSTLVDKLKDLRELDVDGHLLQYLERLKPVLTQLLQTYRGNVDLSFWNTIASVKRLESKSCSPDRNITGWILAFFNTKEQFLTVDGMVPELVPFGVEFKRKSFDGGKSDFLLAGGCRGVSLIGDRIFAPHFSLAVVDFIDYSQIQRPLPIKRADSKSAIKKAPVLKKVTSLNKTAVTKPQSKKEYRLARRVLIPTKIDLK